jgi:hypothetical protein
MKTAKFPSRAFAKVHTCKPWLVALSLAGLLCMQPSFAQSEALSEELSVGLSEVTGDLVGSLVGAGAGLSLGAVLVTGSVAYVTVTSAATATSEVAEFTLQVPLEVAHRLSQRAGERVEAQRDEHGTRLRCGKDVIAYLPNTASTGPSGREQL